MSKTITITNQQIVGFMDYISSDDYCFSKEKLEKEGLKIDTMLSWKLLKLRKKFSDAADLYNQARGEIEKDYVGDDKSETVTDPKTGETVRNVKPEFKQEFISRVTELLKQTSTLTFEPIQMKNIEKYNLAEVDLLSLGNVIVDEDGSTILEVLNGMDSEETEKAE